MNAKKINNDQFKDAIKVSFDGDNDIYPMYNPNVKVEKVDDIVKDISTRIKYDEPNPTIKGLFHNNEIVGYYVFDKSSKRLISFGLSLKLRTRPFLKELWALIRSDLRGKFECYLWSNNKRAIKWLIKNKMNIKRADSSIAHLVYE